MSSQQIPDQEIADWFTNPVTQLFYQHIDKAMTDCHEDKRDAFVPSDPHATQERHAWLLGAEWAFGKINDMREDGMSGEVNDEEYIGD